MLASLPELSGTGAAGVGFDDGTGDGSGMVASVVEVSELDSVVVETTSGIVSELGTVIAS